MSGRDEGGVSSWRGIYAWVLTTRVKCVSES